MSDLNGAQQEDQRCTSSLQLRGGYLNTCGELNSSLHRYAVHSVEHNSKVISGGHEHPWHIAGQAKHPYAVLRVGLRLRSSEKVDGIRLSLHNTRHASVSYCMTRDCWARKRENVALTLVESDCKTRGTRWVRKMKKRGNRRSGGKAFCSLEYSSRTCRRVGR